MDIALLSEENIGRLKELQNHGVTVICYSLRPLSQMRQGVGEGLHHLVGDNLGTFGRNETEETLDLGEAIGGERIAGAVQQVVTSQGWGEKYHLVISPDRYGALTLTKLGIGEDAGALCFLQAGPEGRNERNQWIATVLTKIGGAVGAKFE